MKILVLEDDSAIGMGLKYSLEQENFETTLCTGVTQAYKEIEKSEFDCYLLDLTLPDGSGYDVCKKIRTVSDVPVIFLTAYDDEVNVVMGLDMGADDYISKPFRVRELIARIKSVTRRYKAGENNDTVVVQNVTVKINQAKVYKNGRDVFLTALEYKLFLVLLQNRNKVISRNKLLENIWDVAGDFVNDNTLTVYIKRLRDKVEDDPNSPKIILTVRGMGYMVE